jgi:hypothetical protein
VRVVTTTLAIGIARADRPSEVIARAEARVIRHELARRLDRVVLDLRIDGAPLGPWLPRGSATWPSGVDAVVELDELRSDGSPLTSLFARTVDADAADVRRRMLVHLRLIPAGPFMLDDLLLTEILTMLPRPTDLWLVAAAASEVTTTDHAVRALATAASDASVLDAAFDRVVARLDGVVSAAGVIERVAAERDQASARARELGDELTRANREIADRLDALEAENAVLRERLERCELRRSLGS